MAGRDIVDVGRRCVSTYIGRRFTESYYLSSDLCQIIWPSQDRGWWRCHDGYDWASHCSVDRGDSWRRTRYIDRKIIGSMSTWEARIIFTRCPSRTRYRRGRLERRKYYTAGTHLIISTDWRSYMIWLSRQRRYLQNIKMPSCWNSLKQIKC